MKKLLILFSLASLAACEIHETPTPRVISLTGDHYVEEHNKTTNEAYSYPIRIDAGTDGNDFYIDNLTIYGLYIHAHISEYGDITIPYQVQNDFSIEGRGSVFCEEVTFKYTVRNLREDIDTYSAEVIFWIEPCLEDSWLPSPS